MTKLLHDAKNQIVENSRLKKEDDQRITQLETEVKDYIERCRELVLAGENTLKVGVRIVVALLVFLEGE